MNILFFLEPRIELSAYFRYATLRNTILPQIKGLEKVGVKTHLILGDAIAEKALREGYLAEIKNYTVIDSEELNSVLDLPYNKVAEELYNENKALNSKLSVFYSEKISDFIPDIIISWESNADFFKKNYENSTIINQWPGYLSRLPFPELIAFDSGLLGKSRINIIKNNIQVRSSDLRLWRDSINKYENILNSFNPLIKKVNGWRNKFKKVILFPLQVDNYFTVTVPVQGKKNQLDLVAFVLENIPEDIGVVFTEYRSKTISCNVMTDDNINYLSSRYKNFIFDKDIVDIPQVSQYLANILDGVVTISSSVGLQAALWYKPLLTLGKSHVTPFESANSIDVFVEQVQDNYKNNKDLLIYTVMKTMHPCMEDIKKDPESYKNWLFKIHSAERKNSLDVWPSFYKNDNHFLKRFEGNCRISQFISSNKNYFTQNDSYLTGLCKELSNQIYKKNIISFDIFDTLLVRPFVKPSDLFKFIDTDVKLIVGKKIDFVKVRKDAENEAFKRAIERGEGETTLDEIYSILAISHNLNISQIEQIKKLEIDAECQFLYRREVGYKAYMEAYMLKKEIILVSDMYLPSNILNTILEKNGYIYHNKLFVSSETKVKKHNGRMFDYLLNEIAISKDDILHVGDNIEADVKMPKSRGINTFHLPKTIDCFKKSSVFKVWERDFDKHTLDWKVITGIIANRLMDNPYQDFMENTLFNGSLFNVGYYGGGPLLVGFVKWLIEKSINDGIEVLYFLARDGKIIKEVYDYISPLYPDAPISEYLLCSRRSVNLAKIKNVDDIYDLATVDFTNNIKVGSILENRFGLRHNQVDNASLLKNGMTWETKILAEEKDKLISLVLDLKIEIFENAKKERENYLEYLDNKGLLNSTKNVAIVDIGYAGTMQESLSSIIDKKINGYYLITFRKALERINNNDMNCYGFLGEFIDRHDTYHPFCKHVPLYETLFSSEDTSLIRFEKDWKNNIIPVFMPKMEDESKRVEVVKEMQRGIVQFTMDMLNCLGPYFTKIDIEPNKTLRVLNNFFNDPHPQDARLFQNINFEDAYGGAGIKLILCADDKLDKESCVWRQGRAALLHDLELRKNISLNQKVEKLHNLKLMNIGNLEHQGISEIMKFAFKVEQVIAKPQQKINFLKLNLTNKLAESFLSERKYNKLKRDKQLFINDIRNPLVKKMAQKVVGD